MEKNIHKTSLVDGADIDCVHQQKTFVPFELFHSLTSFFHIRETSAETEWGKQVMTVKKCRDLTPAGRKAPKSHSLLSYQVEKGKSEKTLGLR